MKILFTHSYFLKFDDKQFRTAMPYPPLGTLYAMAYLRENGYTVKLFDTMFCDSPSEIEKHINEFSPDILISYDDCFNYLTKMCLTNMREACFKMLQYARSKGCRTVVSSSDATDHIELYLKNGAEVVAIGEGEQTILELCESFKSTNVLENIEGLAYLDKEILAKTKKRNVLKDLDSLPPPAWDMISIEPYKQMWLNKHGYFSLNFVTTRGCPYKCNWCAKPIYGNRYNTHSPENIVKEIAKWQNQFGFSHIWFADDIFGLKASWVIEFSEYIKQRDLKIKYKIQSRADLLVQENYVSALAASGCIEVWMGAESGSQKILDAMDKGTTVAQIIEARALLKKHQIKACFFLQLGYLGETMIDIEKTIKLVTDTMPDDLGISVSYPLPGTSFYEKVKSDLVTKSNWTDSDDLAMMFKNTYAPEFYKTLHRYIHSVFRKKMALSEMKKSRSVLKLPKQLAAYLKYSILKKVQSFQLTQNMEIHA